MLTTLKVVTQARRSTDRQTQQYEDISSGGKDMGINVIAAIEIYVVALI